VLRGTVQSGFEPVARELARQLRKLGGGAAVCAYHRGRCVVDLWGGVRDASGAPWEPGTMCVSYSTTKGVVSTALHVLADRGLVDYDAPVARYWPEFAQAGKQDITVRALMSHQAGLFNIRDLVDDARQMLDWDHMVDRLAAATPARVPDGVTAYHALTYGYLIGELIHRVTGKPLAQVLADELTGPLGLDGLFIGLPDAHLARAARLLGGPAAAADGEAPRREGVTPRARAIFGAVQRTLRFAGHPVDFERAAAALAPRGISRLDFSSDDVMRACIPAANGMFTARSLARLYAALAGGGRLGAVRLLSPETVARASEIQSDGFDQITLFRMRWRLGYHRVGSFRGVPRHAFGHFGWGGSGAWADPSQELSFAYVVNRGSGTPVGDTRILWLNTILLACARAQAKRPAWSAAAHRVDQKTDRPCVDRPVSPKTATGLPQNQIASASPELSGPSRPDS
jgi:CubicO group peptidase (beta-lactamase class C family)